MDLDSLDPGIAPYVHALRRVGIETFMSCEGGEGHAYSEAIIRFYGNSDVGFRALAEAMRLELPVIALRKFWSIEEGEPVGPHWELAFYREHRSGLLRDVKKLDG